MSHQAKHSTKHLNVPSWLPIPLWAWTWWGSCSQARPSEKQRQGPTFLQQSVSYTSDLSMTKKSSTLCQCVVDLSESPRPHPPPVLQQYHAVHIIFVTTKIMFVMAKYFWRDKHIFAMTNVLWQAYFCHDKRCFSVTTNMCLSRQKYVCHNNSFVATSILLS